MQQQPVSNIKALSILHFSLLIGQIVFGAIAYYLHYSGTMTSIDLGNNVKFILIGLIIMSLVMVALSFSMYKKKVTVLKESPQTTKEKLMGYRAASLIRWAMLEAPVLMAIIAFMLTGSYNLLILAGAVLLLFVSTRPTAAKAAAELSVSEDEVNN